ncbi:MAG TPA: adenosylcobinamide-GDP ribazoletransferase [Stellaceae bacterium]|nr:adenosylcobinamide-GDP ribazoletransferase [Stellaceae bacterium]
MSGPRPDTRRPPGFASDFAAAVAFFTRIPMSPPAAAELPLADSCWAFPLVGAGIGAVVAFIFLAGELTRLGDWPSALLAVLAGLLLTGALHEDGLADTADGIFGAGDRDRRLAIMRDSRHGTFAVLALVVSVGLRAAAIAQIGEVVFAGLALIAAHAVSRALLPIAMWALPPARDDGLGAGAGRPRPARIIAGSVIGLAVAAAALGPLYGVIAIGMAALAVAVAAAIARRRIGGYTGDVLGAFQQIAEVAMLLTALALR